MQPKLIQLLIERFISPNPKLFKILGLLAGLLAGIIQLIFWSDHFFIYDWLTNEWEGLLNDTEFTCLGILGASQLTTTQRRLQVETDEILTRNK